MAPSSISLADFVDFGVAPALLLYFWSLHEIKNFGWFAALAFAIACALRLARFNVMSEDPTRPAWHGDFFVGMPSPAGAVTVLLPLYLHLSVLELPASRAFAPFYILYVLMIAFLMASRIPHFSGKRVGRVPRDLIIPLLFGGGVLLLLLAIYPMEILIALSLAYLALIPFGLRRYNALARQEESRCPTRVISPQLQGAAGADIVDREQQKQGDPARRRTGPRRGRAKDADQNFGLRGRRRLPAMELQLRQLPRGARWRAWL